MKRIAVFGSTGSIGRQTLDVLKNLGCDYQVVALAAGSNDRLIEEQARYFKPKYVALFDEMAAKRLSLTLRDQPVSVMGGEAGLLRIAEDPAVDLAVMAQVGFSGFKPLITALKSGKTIALANKEALVVGGDLLERTGLLDRKRILPVDSEHSAIWQAIGAAPHQEIARILLTASGGPFFGFGKKDLANVTPQSALKHPNWQMGDKITIDSATMMNKGLEVIEAKWLFNLAPEQIEVVIHRQSIVHSMVEYIDGTVIAQLGTPDMRSPIQYALTYPARLVSPVERYNPFGSQLTFDEPDRQNFPCLDLAYRALESGGTMPAVLNGANEVAVTYFLESRIAFTAIPLVIETVMEAHHPVSNFCLDDAVEADSWARQEAKKVITRLPGRMKS